MSVVLLLLPLFIPLSESLCVDRDLCLFQSLLNFSSNSPFLHLSIISLCLALTISLFVSLSSPCITLGDGSLPLLSAVYFPSLQSHSTSFSLSLEGVTSSSPCGPIQSLPGHQSPMSGEDHKPDEGRYSVWRVQGLGPRARVPRGPSSFVPLNPLLGAGRGRRRKCIPHKTPSQNPTWQGGVQMGAWAGPAWHLSLRVIPKGPPVYRKPKT